MKTIAIFLDGTWNKPETQTNVRLAFQALAFDSNSTDSLKRFRFNKDHSGQEQIGFYYPGVGTRPLQWVSGGAFGNGLSRNVLEAYSDLCTHYQPGAQIFLFGFSRGAYTARSLAGLIRNCGILMEPTASLLDQAWNMYVGRDDVLHPDARIPQGFRRSFSHDDPTNIQFLGVWDTVGALGIPSSQAWIPFSRAHYQFHDVALSGIVQHAYHAVALDEHREDYQPTMWAVESNEDITLHRIRAQTAKARQTVEQRWFVGAHANVGGGYKNDRLASIPLAWMCDKAAALGLEFHYRPVAEPEAYRDDPVDSYAQFMFGAYKIYKRNRRYNRIFGCALNESVDESVWARWHAQPAYRPPSLLKYASKLGV